MMPFQKGNKYSKGKHVSDKTRRRLVISGQIRGAKEQLVREEELVGKIADGLSKFHVRTYRACSLMRGEFEEYIHKLLRGKTP